MKRKREDVIVVILAIIICTLTLPYFLHFLVVGIICCALIIGLMAYSFKFVASMMQEGLK